MSEVPTGRRWEESALARSLASARARSSAQAHRLVDAARQLVGEVGPDFTVQQVAARAGVSLKTLYRTFPGKDVLLLAVFEEDNRMGADLLAQAIARHQSPVDRIRAFVVGLFELSTGRPNENYIALVMREYFRLSQGHADQVEHVLRPFVELLAAEVQAAADHGAIRSVDPERDAAAIFLLTVSHLCPLVLADRESDSEKTANFVADFCLRALGAGEVVE